MVLVNCLFYFKVIEEKGCKCRRCNKQFETLNLLNNHHCFTKEAPPMKKCDSVAVNNGKFIFDNQFVSNLNIVVSHR